MTRSVILASGSPRRHALFKECCNDFKVMLPAIPNENLNANLPLEKALEDLALRKAESVAEDKPKAVVVGADTVVVHQGNVLGKPVDEEDALNMLRSLLACTHNVITAWAVVCQETGWRRTGHCVSTVYFNDATDESLMRYISGGEPMDKAGGYAIQGEGAFLINRFEGSYNNIVGLPVEDVCHVVREARALL